MKYYAELTDLNITGIVASSLAYLHKHHQNIFEEQVQFFQPLNFSQFNQEVPELVECFATLGLEPVFVAALVMTFPNTDIHRDPGAKEDWARINVPILNCEYSETRFFKMKEGIVGTTNINENDCDIVDSLTLSHATALAIGHPHQVVMLEGNYPRISLSVNFKDNAAARFLVPTDGIEPPTS